MLFSGLSPEEFQDFILWSKAISQVYGPGQAIFQEGQEALDIYVLLRGHVEVDQLSPSGRRTVVAHFSQEHSIFGEVYALLGIPFDYSAWAKEESVILKIPGQAVLRTLGNPSQEKIAKNLVRLLASKAYSLNQRLMVQTAPSLREKILMDLAQRQKDGQVVLSFSREKWAEILAVPRPSLSRELSKMQEDGLISIDKRTISLLNEIL